MTDFEKKFLEMYGRELEEARDRHEDILKAVCYDTGARMMSAKASIAPDQRKIIADNARWAYKEITGRDMP